MVDSKIKKTFSPKKAKKVSVHFSGSIAFYFQSEIQAMSAGFTMLSQHVENCSC